MPLLSKLEICKRELINDGMKAFRGDRNEVQSPDGISKLESEDMNAELFVE
jgi:hypothetical protein